MEGLLRNQAFRFSSGYEIQKALSLTELRLLGGKVNKVVMKGRWVRRHFLKSGRCSLEVNRRAK